MLTPRCVSCLLPVLVLAVVMGCTGAPPPKPEPSPCSAENPGPWQEIKKPAVTIQRTARLIRATVAVDGYPKRPGDYIQRFELFDDGGKRAGERIFEYAEQPTQTFILSPGTESVYAVVTATTRGRWQTETVPVPPPPKK